MVTKYFAKPILDGRFWILEQDGRKLGTICKQGCYNIFGCFLTIFLVHDIHVYQ